MKTGEDHFDPKTGKIDKAKFEKLRKVIYEKINDQFKTDALLYATIIVAPAQYSGGLAYFCNTKQRASSAGKIALEILLTGPAHGQIPDSCLVVAMSDMNDKTIYGYVGGIEILAKVKVGNIEEIPAQELFRNNERIREAVRIALSPLTSPYE